MFTSQSLRSVVRPGDLAVREQRLDDVVHQMDLKGSLDDGNAPELERRIGAALAGAAPDVAPRINAFEVAHRPALAANVDQAIMILKMLRPKTAVPRPKQRITSLTLPRIEPRGSA